MNEYFELVEDDDFDGKHAWIFICPECGALFKSKAIPGRTIFPWFGYHPDDGNCQVITRDTANLIRDKAENCECKSHIERVKKVSVLKNAIEKIKESGEPMDGPYKGVDY